jgi:hypothetical protein
MMRRGPQQKALLLGLAFVLVMTAWSVLHRMTPAHGLLARYFDNDSWSGEPVETRLDQKILFDKMDLSDRAGYSDKYSIIWEGFIYAAKDSRYVLAITSDDGSWVYVDDRLMIDNGGQHPSRRKERELPLTKGNHKIVIRYFDAGGRGKIDFSWREAGSRPRLFPGFFLYPRPASQALYRFDQVRPTFQFILKWTLSLLALGLVFCLSRKIFPCRDIAFHLCLCLFLTLFTVYAFQLYSKRSTAVTGCDTYAYLQGALRMAEKGLLRTELEDPLIPEIHQAFKENHGDQQTIFFFSPHGHYVFDLRQGLIYNVFPPGVSLLLLPIVKLAGFRASFFALPLLNLACLLWMFYLASKYVHVVFGMCASGLAFFNSQVFENSVALMSDVPSMVLLALSLFLLFKTLGKRHWALPLAAGIVFGFSLVVRYSNLMGGLPLLLLFLIQGRETKNPKATAMDVLGFSGGMILFGLFPLAFYTRHLFGTFLRLVYEPMTQSQFRLSHLGPGAVFYLGTTYRICGWLGILCIGLGLVTCLVQPKRRLVGFLCALGYFSFFIFYSLHGIRNERYLIPAIPFLALLYGFGALAVWHKLARTKVLRLVTVAILAAYPLVFSLPHFRIGIVREETTALAVQKVAGAGAVILCDDMSGPLRLYAGFSTFRLTWTDDATLRETASILQAMNRPVYFYLDSESAQTRYLDLISRSVFEAKNFREVALLNGRPLYRYETGGAAALTNPHSPR